MFKCVDELGNDFTQMYQVIGDINDEQVPGLESILDYMSNIFFSKDDPATNEHHFHITKTQYNEETHNINNIYKTKTYHIKNDRFTDGRYYIKNQM